jgi:hypothetical protein
MSRTRVPASFDARIGAIAERVVRKLSRRDALRGVVVGGTAGLAALALGERPAWAQECDCGPTRRCDGCPGVGCPPGYHLCKGSYHGNCFNSQGYRCEWPSGFWIACMNLGGGLGYKICYDCINHTGCPNWCTCLSTCICCHCRDARDVRAEQHRLQEQEVR